MFTTFLKKKSEAIEDFMNFYKLIIKRYHKKPKYIRCDNSGENNKIAKMMKEKYPEVIFEFTAKNTPEQNGKLERYIATTWGRTRSLLNSTGLPNELRGRLWCEAFSTSIKLWNISASKVGDKLRCEKWNNYIPNYAYGLCKYGEIGIVKHSGIIKKTDNKGYPCAMVGYGEDHATGVYRMLNVETKRVSVTRDIKWMNMNFKRYINLEEKGTSEESDSSIKGINISNATSNNKENGQNASEGNPSSNDSNSNNIKPSLIKSEYVEEEEDTSVETIEINNKCKNNKRPMMERELKNLDITMNDTPLKTVTIYNTRSKSKSIEKSFHMDEYIYDDSTNTGYTGETMPMEYMYYSAIESGYKEPKNIQSNDEIKRRRTK